MFTAAEEDGPAATVVSRLTLVIIRVHRVTADVAEHINFLSQNSDLITPV